MLLCVCIAVQFLLTFVVLQSEGNCLLLDYKRKQSIKAKNIKNTTKIAYQKVVRFFVSLITIMKYFTSD